MACLRNILKPFAKSTRANSRSGFTFVELMLVIVVSGTLVSVAIPSFVDFRREGNITTSRAFASNLRSAVLAKKTQAALQCNRQLAEANPTIESVRAGDITAGGDCTPEQITDANARKFLDGGSTFTIPINPANGLDTIVECACTDICDAACQGIGGYCYNRSAMLLWAPGLEPSCGEISYFSSSTASDGGASSSEGSSGSETSSEASSDESCGDEGTNYAEAYDEDSAMTQCFAYATFCGITTPSVVDGSYCSGGGSSSSSSTTSCGDSEPYWGGGDGYCHQTQNAWNGDQCQTYNTIQNIGAEQCCIYGIQEACDYISNSSSSSVSSSTTTCTDTYEWDNNCTCTHLVMRLYTVVGYNSETGQYICTYNGEGGGYEFQCGTDDHYNGTCNGVQAIGVDGSMCAGECPHSSSSSNSSEAGCPLGQTYDPLSFACTVTCSCELDPVGNSSCMESGGPYSISTTDYQAANCAASSSSEASSEASSVGPSASFNIQNLSCTCSNPEAQTGSCTADLVVNCSDITPGQDSMNAYYNFGSLSLGAGGFAYCGGTYLWSGGAIGIGTTLNINGSFGGNSVEANASISFTCDSSSSASSEAASSEAACSGTSVNATCTYLGPSTYQISGSCSNSACDFEMQISDSVYGSTAVNCQSGSYSYVVTNPSTGTVSFNAGATSASYTCE